MGFRLDAPDRAIRREARFIGVLVVGMAVGINSAEALESLATALGRIDRCTLLTVLLVATFV